MSFIRLHWQFLLLATLSCISNNMAQTDPNELLCLINPSTGRRVLTTRTDMSNFSGFVVGGDPDECIGIPYTASAGTGFAANYCDRVLPESELIYCPDPGCVCRYDTSTSQYQVHHYINAYQIVTAICQLQNNSTFTGVGKINYSKCLTVVDANSNIWKPSTKSCAELQ